jgi:hypothetical protein
MAKIDITPGQSIAALMADKENGQLAPEHIRALAELISDTRPAVSGAGKLPEGEFEATHVKSEEAAENSALAVYRQSYDRLSDDAKLRCGWETAAARLLANGSEKLKKAEAMQGGGELVGIDSKGKALFKDRGVEPVMYGFDNEDRLICIYDREPEQMGKIKKWADYSEIRGQVLKDGYELFADDGNYNFSDEMKQAEDHTKEPFVASKDRKEWRVSWLESGDKPAVARFVLFYPVVGRVLVGDDDPAHRVDSYGAVRLLRV